MERFARPGLFLAAAVLLPACGGGGGGSGGGPAPFVPAAVFRADKETVGLIELYAADLSGTTVKLSGTLASNRDVQSFSWSPDRQWVAFVADKDTLGLFELYVV